MLEESILYNLLTHPFPIIPLVGHMEMLVTSNFLILICIISNNLYYSNMYCLQKAGILKSGKSGFTNLIFQARYERKD